MIIKTKFDIGEKAVVIDDDGIKTLDVFGVEYINKTIIYSFRTGEAISSMNVDRVIYRDEDECFKSIKELAEYYENRQNS